jgi:hypothetical protein
LSSRAVRPSASDDEVPETVREIAPKALASGPAAVRIHDWRTDPRWRLGGEREHAQNENGGEENSAAARTWCDFGAHAGESHGFVNREP